MSLRTFVIAGLDALLTIAALMSAEGVVRAFYSQAFVGFGRATIASFSWSR